MIKQKKKKKGSQIARVSIREKGLSVKETRRQIVSYNTLSRFGSTRQEK